MNEKLKEGLLILLIVAVVGVTTVTMFFPEYLKYPYSIKAIKITQSEIESISNELTRTEREIPDQIMSRDAAIQSAKESSEKSQDLQQKLNMEDLNYHIPSLLITLEQAAVNIGIPDKKFYIEYDSIKTNSGIPGGDPMPENREEGAPNDGAPKEDPRKDEKPATPEPGTQTEEPAPVQDEGYTPGTIAEGDPQLALTIDRLPTIPGVKITTIPLKLKGVSYAEAQAYIAFLDDLDFVEPTFVDLYSNGSLISVVALIHVFHREGGAQ